MNPDEDLIFTAQRLLTESMEVGRQCAEFYERENELEALNESAQNTDNPENE